MTLQELRQHREALIGYLRSRVALEDWHGVSDAANDLRVLEAEIRVGAAASRLVVVKKKGAVAPSITQQP